MSAFALNELFANVIGQDGQVVDPSIFANKMIGLYFSAHWCGPCRNFTPRLAERYNKLVEEGEQIEIIFVSADEDEEQGMDYFKSMPWKMLKFENRDMESRLSSTYQVRGIPTLVLLDTDGTLITNEGREALMETTPSKVKNFAAEKAEKERLRVLEIAELKANFNVAKFFASKKVVDKDGNAIDAASLQDKIVGLYFSAHWCPPCRGFTPVLAEKYKALVSESNQFEIIFISSDRDANSAQSYFSEMPWKMLEFGDRSTKSTLSELFDISGIPTLVLVYPDGTFTDEGRDAVVKCATVDKLKTFIADRKAEEERLAAEIAGYPEIISVTNHEHPLKKLPTIYRGQYGCDGCGGGGAGWVYHCDECGFDLHPKCAMDHKKEE